MVGSILRVRYELTQELPSTPIFQVFAARDRTTNVERCVRIFKPPFDKENSFIEAMLATARRTAGINHPGIEQIEELDVDEGRAFLVSQYSPGIVVAERIRRLAPFSVPVAVGTAISILESLDALHVNNIVHGDVSSTNTMIGPDGSARLMMAGVWQAYSKSSTAGAVVLPTMAPYMAPEISSGSSPSQSTDVYSVGVLLYELLCGRLPYAAETSIAMAMRHATAPTPSVKSYAPSAPMVLDQIVQKAMQKDPSLRYRNAAGMLADLRILQEALRFGKTLTWPLRPEPAGQAPKQSIGRAAPTVQPVAPRMSAVRDTGPSTTSRRRNRNEEESGDVPAWLMYAIVAAAAIVGGGILTWMIINFTKPKMIVVPNLVNKDVAEARTQLRGLKLELRESAHEPSERAPDQTILRTNPEAGEKIQEGSTVNATISSGSKMVELPSLVGMTIDQARSLLKDLDVSVEEMPERIAASGVPEGAIVKQDPAAHEKLEKRSTVRVTLSNGEAANGAPSQSGSDTTPPPPSQNQGITGNDTSSGPDDKKSEYTLRFKISDSADSVMVRIEIEDSHGSRTVFNEARGAGESVDFTATGYGPAATFKIYYNGDLKKVLHEQAN